ncbi:hypothetical protein ACLQ2P_26055 [Actinomadura citrea]|uniref:hypothetical protein n=1 Tax=Actinomadura citrea TaxID=46158 RepID=UPI003CE45E67
MLIISRDQGREFRIGVECRDHRRANDIELVTPERPIPTDGPLGRPGRPRLEFREVIRDRLISVSGHVHRDGRLQRIPLAAGGAVFNAEGAQITSIAQIVACILDKADLRQAVADASGQAGELRAEVDDLVLRSADGGEPVRARSPTCTSP